MESCSFFIFSSLYKELFVLYPFLAVDSFSSPSWYLLAVDSLVQLLQENECLMESCSFFIFSSLYKELFILYPFLAVDSFSSPSWYLLAVDSLVQLLQENECLMESCSFFIFSSL